MSESDVPVISFVEGLPGLPGLTDCLLVSLDDDATIFSLRSVADPDLRLLVIVPFSFFPDYEVEVADEVAAVLDLREGELPLILLVVNPGAGLADATANLLAPILVNPRSRQAVQMLQASDELALRAPLLGAGR